MLPLPKRILVPTDFGAAAEAALDYAIMLGRAASAEVVELLHVYERAVGPRPEMVGDWAVEAGERIVHDANASMHGLLETRRSPFVNFKMCLVEGPAAAKILEIAALDHIDLIVMGSHGRKGLSRLLVGSVAEKVVRAARVPVLVVHGREQ